mgnify:CR=1 FL=1
MTGGWWGDHGCQRPHNPIPPKTSPRRNMTVDVFGQLSLATVAIHMSGNATQRRFANSIISPPWLKTPTSKSCSWGTSQYLISQDYKAPISRDCLKIGYHFFFLSNNRVFSREEKSFSRFIQKNPNVGRFFVSPYGADSTTH